MTTEVLYNPFGLSVPQYQAIQVALQELTEANWPNPDMKRKTLSSLWYLLGYYGGPDGTPIRHGTELKRNYFAQGPENYTEQRDQYEADVAAWDRAINAYYEGRGCVVPETSEE